MSENTHTQTLENQICVACGVVFAVTAHYDRRRQKDHATFHCPNGHKQNYVVKTTKDPDELQTEIDKLKTENKELRTNNIRLSAQVDQLEAQLAETDA